MAPTEHSILSTFLLNPASLQTFMTLEQFTALFPRTQRGNPQIKFLYRELQYQRALVTDQVKKEITAEIKRGQKLQREVARARRKAEQDNFGLDPNDGREIDMEIELFGQTSNLPTNKSHTLQSILPEMATAHADLEAEIAAMEAEAESTLTDMKTIVGDLSDLRYGKFSRTSSAGEGLSQDVLEGLKGLREVCDGLERN